MTTFFRGAMVNADFVGANRQWVFINWLYPGRHKFSAVKDVKRIEAKIRQEKLKGWYAASEKDHTTMHAILKKMKANQFREDEHSFYFIREV